MPADAAPASEPVDYIAACRRFVRIRNGGSEVSTDALIGSAVNLLMQWGSRWQRCLKVNLFSADRVLELQILGVQKISSIAREAGQIFQRLAG